MATLDMDAPLPERDIATPRPIMAGDEIGGQNEAPRYPADAFGDRDMHRWRAMRRAAVDLEIVEYGVRFDVFGTKCLGGILEPVVQAGLGPEAMRDQGFITSTGRFVDRGEALAIARTAGQIRTKTGPEGRAILLKCG